MPAQVAAVPSPAPADRPAVARPRIDAPTSGEVFSPGPVSVRGVAQPGAILELRNQATGAWLAALPVPDSGVWQTVIELRGEGTIALIAQAPGPDGTLFVSDPVLITLAPPVQPVTGATLVRDPLIAGRTFTLLLALFFASAGFTCYTAGRLLLTLAQDRLKPR